jgi:hypothetical protein
VRRRVRLVEYLLTVHPDRFITTTLGGFPPRVSWPPEEVSAHSLPNARNLSLSGVKPGKDVGEVKQAKDVGRLPMEDHNTRIIV